MVSKKIVQPKRRTNNFFVAAIFAAAILAGYIVTVGTVSGKSGVTPVVAAAPAIAPAPNESDPATKNWTYNFGDQADGALPAEDWQFEIGPGVASYHDELQTYTANTSNVRIQDGVLIIEARKETLDDKTYTSGRIHTLGDFSFTYGTLEIDMMLPQGKGSWPAAWLMPRDNRYAPETFGISKDDKLAWALNGEIDVMEAIGRLPGQNLPTIHSYNELQRQPTYTPAFVKNPYTQYHKYGIIKTPTKITFTLDGVPYASREKTTDNPLDWPFDQPYYLILNLAVGGTWAGTDGIDDASFPWQLKVKSITYRGY